MAWEDIGERLGALGWVGAGLGMVILVPALVRGLRPVAKGTLKGCMALSDKTHELLAETSERWQDLVAEARAEHEGCVKEGNRDAEVEPAAGDAVATTAAPGTEEEPTSKARSSRKSEPSSSEAA
jgi:hypothetical protein